MGDKFGRDLKSSNSQTHKLKSGNRRFYFTNPLQILFRSSENIGYKVGKYLPFLTLLMFYFVYF